jgi:hypothetical protein
MKKHRFVQINLIITNEPCEKNNIIPNSKVIDFVLE